MAKQIVGRVGLTISGKWDPLKDYEILTEVSHNGSSYHSIKANRGVEPGTDEGVWMLSAQKGEKGEKGEQGPQGERGLQGERGVQGAVGPKGDQGQVGPKGERGEQGQKGDQGDVGPQGPKGDDGKGGGITPITYAELKALRNASKLEPGAYYRITDFVTTAMAYGDSDTGGKVKSAGHPFDLIVRVASVNKLFAEAEAVQHDGDEYFKDNDLTAWQLWYDLDNDNIKYAWVDKANGKGVIYRMIDEKGNDCPYDFKNILMYCDKYTSNQTPDNYYYTFSYNVGGVLLYDGSVEKQVTTCYGNVMEKYIPYQRNQSINFNIFLNDSLGKNCSMNTFGDDCYSNTFWDDCHHNTFGKNCLYNTFGKNCRSNTFGDDCRHNTFGKNCRYNTFGDDCLYNTFGDDCYHNTFGDDCYSNTFWDDCHHNTFGKNCLYNTFGKNCRSNTFGDDCRHNTFGKNCRSNNFGDGVGAEWAYQAKHYGDNFWDNNLTIFEKYYDDGSGQVVPVRHPDLSTQPSILPYKIGGQYVYEQVFTNLKHLAIPENSTLLNVHGSFIDSTKNRKMINPSEMYVSPSNELIFPQLSEVSDVYIVIQYFIKSEEGSYYGYGY